MTQNLPPRETLAYAPHYCEENIFRLVSDYALFSEQYRVLFISNQEHLVAMKHQRAARENSLVYWDYHVVLLYSGEPSLIWDFDTYLPFPSEARTYLRESFLPSSSSTSDPLFRIIPAGHYAEEFHSDRSHMRNSNGDYIALPPRWPPIAPERGNWIEYLLDPRTDEPAPFVPLPALMTLLAPK